MKGSFRAGFRPFSAGAWLIVTATAFALMGCQAVPQARPVAVAAELLLFHRFIAAGTLPAVPVDAAADARQTPTASDAAPAEAAPAGSVAEEDPTAEAAPVEVEAAATNAAAAAASPVTVADSMPVSLSIPALAWSVAVVPMGWEAVLVDGVPTTRWVVPEDAGGWAVNSAAPGAPGNMIVVGQQALGQALFRPLALGEAEIGDAIDVTTADGRTYGYQVVEVSPPIPAIGATLEEQATADAYLAPGESVRLTVVTGWPGDVSTHRIFVVAEYVGPLP
jgi:sortase (surface protein transpeptidase)